MSNTVFENQKNRINYSECSILIFQLWHFPPIFVFSKMTCLVTLFGQKLQIFKKSPKRTFTN